MSCPCCAAAEFSDFCSQIEAFAASELGVHQELWECSDA